MANACFLFMICIMLEVCVTIVIMFILDIANVSFIIK